MNDNPSRPDSRAAVKEVADRSMQQWRKAYLEALPQRIEAYLADAGLSDHLLARQIVQWGLTDFCFHAAKDRHYKQAMENGKNETRRQLIRAPQQNGSPQEAGATERHLTALSNLIADCRRDTKPPEMDQATGKA